MSFCSAVAHSVVRCRHPQSLVWNTVVTARLRELGHEPVVGDLVFASAEEAAKASEDFFADAEDEVRPTTFVVPLHGWLKRTQQRTALYTPSHTPGHGGQRAAVPGRHSRRGQGADPGRHRQQEVQPVRCRAAGAGSRCGVPSECHEGQVRGMGYSRKATRTRTQSQPSRPYSTHRCHEVMEKEGVTIAMMAESKVKSVCLEEYGLASSSRHRHTHVGCCWRHVCTVQRVPAGWNISKDCAASGRNGIQNTALRRCDHAAAAE